MKKFLKLTKKDLGENVPRRGGTIAPVLADKFLKLMGWKIVGNIPNIPQAVCLAVPHTSNQDGLYAIPTLLSLDLNINILGKKSLFEVPVLASFLRWSGVVPIDRNKKSSTLQANIDLFKTGKPFFLGLAPEGTRGYTDRWKTGFYYIALGAEVPILPIAMDYETKEVRFLDLVHPTGDIEADMPKILALYEGVVPRYPDKLSKPLQEINKK